MLRASLIPLVTIMGMSLGSLLGGTVVVEKIFAIPGIGMLVLDSLTKRDYPTIQAFILLIGVWIFMMNRMQGGGKGGAMGFGKSKAKLLTEKHGRVTFDDVAGIDEAKEELEEIVEFLRNPQKFSRLGGKIPKGALLVGPVTSLSTAYAYRTLRGEPVGFRADLRLGVVAGFRERQHASG